MAKASNFSWLSLLLRILAAAILVLLTYNPEGWSYYHWTIPALPSFSVLKGFAGVSLLIGWVILLRATIASLGILGIILSVAFFGLAIWLLVDVIGLQAGNLHVITYIVEAIIIAVLGVGVSWSHIRRRITGQVDTDELDHEL
ncbi:MAG: hypothetical protein KZQ58_09305 [gamma proteobacterium symbiont of Bathyaustriella thionipta]|nr:hypothetical protein [gamma proteobacterium symbiont of Bathyaustriella thionipta]